MSEVELILNRLKTAIRDSGMSLSQLSEKTDIPKSTLQRWTSGQIKRIPIDQIVTIAKAINASLEWILVGKNLNEKR